MNKRIKPDDVSSTRKTEVDLVSNDELSDEELESVDGAMAPRDYWGWERGFKVPPKTLGEI